MKDDGLSMKSCRGEGAIKKWGRDEARRKREKAAKWRSVFVCVLVCVARWLQRVATSQRNRCRSHDQPLPRRW